MGNESMIWEGHPTWRAMLSFHIKWFIVTLVLFGLLLLIRWAGVDLDYALIGAVLVAGIALTIMVGWIERFFTQYTITTKRLNIRRGILSKTESSTNVDRIQNITVKQSPVDRIMKVGSIDFDTAGDESSDRFSFLGVNNPQDLRERIMHARDDEKAGMQHDPQGGLGLNGRVGRATPDLVARRRRPRDVGRAGRFDGTGARERVTFIGDSIASAITYDAPSKKVLANGIDLDLQLAVCRRLVGESCPYQGVRPLSLVDLLPTIQLGSTVVVEVGYNDFEDPFADSVEASLQALRKAGAERVLWLTLRADRTSYLEHERRDPGRCDAASRDDGGRLEPLLTQPSRLVPG